MLSAFPLVSLKDAQIAHGDKIVFEKVNLDIRKGEFLYLIGKTGSGKSSLLRTLYADLPLKNGFANVAGYDVGNITPTLVPFLRREIGIIFQDFQLFSDRNVFDNLAFVLKATGKKDKKSIAERINVVLDMTGMSSAIYKMPYNLSGGEQQRIAIARALLNEPSVIFADEPTGNLDPTVAGQILELFANIQQTGTAVLMATHNHGFLKKIPARVLYAENGELKDFSKEEVEKKMWE
jgi:cell division transport system ATP-binding protein